MNFRLSYFLINELGRRSNQEDTIYPSLFDPGSAEGLFILCDGMGGHASGELASLLVCKTLVKVISDNSQVTDLFKEELFDRALSAAYDALDANDYEKEKKMGTTLTLVRFHSGGCFIAHIGDSRIYHIRPSEHRVMYVTRDHSLINDLVELGEMTPAEARVSSKKNVITRAMQPHQSHRAKADTFNISDLESGDYFFMCSDGMLEQLDDNQLLDIISAPYADENKIQFLKEATQNNQDNHSAILIHLLSDNRESSEEPTVSSGKRFSKYVFVGLLIGIVALILLMLI